MMRQRGDLRPGEEDALRNFDLETRELGRWTVAVERGSKGPPFYCLECTGRLGVLTNYIERGSGHPLYRCSGCRKPKKLGM